MATKKSTKASTAIDKATVSKLAELADAVLGGDYANGYLARADEDREYFFGKTRSDGTPEPTEVQFSEGRQFGNLWTGKDYAFRVVSNPAHRERLLSELNSYPNVDVTDAHRTALIASLDLLAKMQPSDVITDVDYDDSFWADYLGEFVEWIRTGEINEDRIDG